MRIVTLIENLVYKQNLVAEHGLAFYLETENKKILFDTGQSGAFIKNAEKLGINISDIDVVVISHGHYDHTGGLYPFLLANSKAKVICKKEVFIPKYHGNTRFIGITYDPLILDERIEYVTEITEIDKEVYILPQIPIINPSFTSFDDLNIKKFNVFEKDEFQDELFLTIVKNDEISIISSCSHRGITNILAAALSGFELPINLILGGFHIKNCGEEQYSSIISCLQSLAPKSVGVCHCTGVEKYTALIQDCKLSLFYNYTGFEINL